MGQRKLASCTVKTELELVTSPAVGEAVGAAVAVPVGEMEVGETALVVGDVTAVVGEDTEVGETMGPGAGAVGAAVGAAAVGTAVGAVGAVGGRHLTSTWYWNCTPDRPHFFDPLAS